MAARLIEDLLSILGEAKEWIRRPGNDYTWSSWDNTDDAVKEIEGLEKRMREGEAWTPMEYAILFSPTGALQEVSLSSGWGNEFLELADRADKSLLKYKNKA